MKKQFYFILAIALVAVMAAGCKKEVEQRFTLNGNTLLFSTNPLAANSEHILVDTLVQSEFAEILSANGIDADKVKSVNLKSATLRIVDPVDGNFDAFDYANAHIKAGSLDQKQLAFRTEVPDGVNEFTLESQGDELLEYLRQSDIQFVVKAYNSADVPATSYALDVQYEVLYTVIE